MPQLDGLRAIAVGLVLLQHYGAPSPWMSAVGPGGLGVSLFFVLSGFLLTGILLDARPAEGAPVWPTLRVFYARRFLRILPLYYLVLATTALLDLGPARRALGYNVLYLANVYFARRGAWDGPISPLWSLAVEEQFYLLWPWLVLGLSMATARRAAIALACAGPLFRLGFLGLFGPSPFALLLPLGYTDQLAWGGVLAFVARERSASALRALDAAALVALPLWVASALAPPARVGGPWWLLVWALRPTAVALLSLACVRRAARGIDGPAGALLASAPLTHVGKVSYGVYLLHPWVHYSAYGLCELPGMGWLRPAMDALRADAWRWFPLGCATAIALATVSYELFERRVLSLNDRVRYPLRAPRGPRVP
jgi:peptidoglycan/LPS O-acetylase OafA/YrhL